MLAALMLTGTVQAAGEAAIDAALADRQRPASDRERDAGRKPDRVLGFVGVTPGATVLDMFASGGYYTEILSRTVGSEGKVVAHNNKACGLSVWQNTLGSRVGAG